MRVNADAHAKANVAINVFSLLWVAPEKVLGDHFELGVFLPVGYQSVDVDVTARAVMRHPAARRHAQPV